MTAGRRLQKINLLLHTEPWASLAYGIFWFVALTVAAPIVAVLGLLPLTLYRVLSWHFDWNSANQHDPNKASNQMTESAILVTGCDSGFGKEIALVAAKSRFVVFAGCLKKESIEWYEHTNSEPGASQIIPLLLDVTKDDDVNNAAAQVSAWLAAGDTGESKTKRVLHALVNNAGIGIPGYLDWVEVADCATVMDVNYFGVLRCCKALLPIFKDQAIHKKHQGGRIINVTSVAGLLPGNAIGWSYAASKQAAQAFTEGLREELGSFGIQVTSINPGFHKTPIFETVETSMTNVWGKMSTELRNQYGKGILDEWLSAMKVFVSIAFPPLVVANVVLETLKIRNAPAQVLVGMDAKFLFIAFRLFPSWIGGGVLLQTPTPAVMMQNSPAT